MDRVLAGRYELEVLLGRGGSGEVWRASDLATRRTVAVKLVELSLVDNPRLLAESIARFRREASVISGLRHPNVEGAIDAGRMGNQLFMVMELASGISLAAMMDERGARGKGLFPVASVLRIAEQVCAGLGAAHAADIVHRDIKPSNLMVTPPLGVKIIDFGTARLLADNASRLALPPAQTVGTIAYMSPEQAQGFDVDPRTDLYSLGCVLYQLLAGHPPFFSTLPSALLMMQVMDPAVPLGSVKPDLPPDVCQLVSDMMEKERDARPANAEQVLSRIAEIREQHGDELGDEELAFEADRETVQAGDRTSTGGAHRLGNVAPETVRSTVLTPERMIQLSAPNTVLSGSGAVLSAPATVAAGALRPPANPFRASTPFAPAAPAVPTQAGPLGSLPQPAARTGPTTGAGTGQGGALPQWPVTPRPRRPWRAVLSILAVAAVAAGAGAFLWVHTHQPLRITKVGVTAAKLNVGCGGTAHIIGAITTNGHAGAIQYQWVLNGTKKPVLTADAAAGRDTVQVTMSWPLPGKGNGQDVAELETLTPGSNPASIVFPYSCPG